MTRLLARCHICWHRRAAIGALLVLAAPATGQPPPHVTFESLLQEMVDRLALAELPDPPYACRQFSSYDRRSVTPDDPDTWFANNDRGQFLRFEEREGRREGVMMDATGPGAVVRLWSANAAGTLRIYLDGFDEPTLALPMASLMDGSGPIAPPLSARRARGFNLYLPIPYASRCMITTDAPDGMYYQINVRAYPAGTRVESFRDAWLTEKSDAIAAANETLQRAAPVPIIHKSRFDRSFAPGETAVIYHMSSPGALAWVQMRLESDDVEPALRQAVLLGEFDGSRTIACPVGDFFGSAPGVNPYQSWPMEVRSDGSMISRWVMPFQREARLLVKNTSGYPMTVHGKVGAIEYQWNDRSMHFHAKWRTQEQIPTQPRRDWNYAQIRGQGVWAGDALHIANPVPQWWGEGDEHVSVDRESFPSHFGTGTEDYYGYAWADSTLFAAPFHNQTRCDGPGNFGLTSVNRFRSLDAIPFTESLRFDMEVWHWATTNISFAATCYYYARPGATDNLLTDDIDPATLSIPKLELDVFRRPGAIEAEDLAIVGRSPGVELDPQALGSGEEGSWSGMEHLWCRTTETGQWVDLRVPIVTAGRYEVIVYPTRSWDYGIVQFSVNGQSAGDPLDTFNSESPDQIGRPRPCSLGTFELAPPGLTLRVEVVGTNGRSRPPHYFWGLDCVVLKPVE